MFKLSEFDRVHLKTKTIIHLIVLKEIDTSSEFNSNIVEVLIVFGDNTLLHGTKSAM